MKKEIEGCLDSVYKSERNEIEEFYQKSINMHDFTINMRDYFERLLVELTEEDCCPLSDKNRKERLSKISCVEIARDYFKAVFEDDELIERVVNEQAN